MNPRQRPRAASGAGEARRTTGVACGNAWVGAVIAVFLSLGTSCSGDDAEPTLEEAAADLIAAGTAALKDPASSNGYEITDPGTNFAQCGPGRRAIRTFAGTGTMEPGGSDLDSFLDGVQQTSASAVIQTQLGFELTSAGRDFNDDLKYRVVLLAKDEGQIQLRIVVRPSGYEVIGSTGCLKSK